MKEKGQRHHISHPKARTFWRPQPQLWRDKVTCKCETTCYVKERGVKTALKGQHPTMFFLLHNIREPEKRRKKSWRKKERKKRNLNDQLTTHRHLAPMAYHSAHPIPKGLFIKTVPPWKVDEIGSTHSWSQHYDVRGQLHTLYALPSSKQVRYRVEQKHNMHLDLPDIIVRTGILRLRASLTNQVWLTKIQTYSLAY